MNKYKLTTLKKKKAIVEAALTLFKEKGFTDVSIKEIAAMAQVSQVTIYNYFGSKEALVVESAKIVMESTSAKAKEILATNLSFSEKLILALKTCTETANMALSNYFTKTALGDPVLSKLLKESINESKLEIYKDYIEVGKKDGSISSELPTELILLYLASINAIDFSNVSSEKTFEHIDAIHTLALYGILGKPDKAILTKKD